jgi:hypothetical protein
VVILLREVTRQRCPWLCGLTNLTSDGGRGVTNTEHNTMLLLPLVRVVRISSMGRGRGKEGVMNRFPDGTLLEECLSRLVKTRGHVIIRQRGREDDLLEVPMLLPLLPVLMP